MNFLVKVLSAFLVAVGATLLSPAHHAKHAWEERKWSIIGLIVIIFIGCFLFIDDEDFVLNEQTLQAGKKLEGYSIAYELLDNTQNTTRFSNVGGATQAKEKLLDVLNYLKNPASYSRLGANPPKSLLLYGPPGTGKTLLARALAGEANINFISTSGASFDQEWVGLGAKRVREIFEIARIYAPCILFIDEIDTLLPIRSTESSQMSGKNVTVGEFLNEMDNINQQRNAGVFLMGATNYIRNIDPAALRSGRFDWKIKVSKPNLPERVDIFYFHLSKVRYSKGLNVLLLGRLTEGFTGADIELIVNEATVYATKHNYSEVNEEAFVYAIKNWKNQSGE